jgi:tetratricopeptide (TPR) repeat protein
MGDLEEAREDSLEGIEYGEKTDSYYVRSMLYANTARDCAKLGDSNRLEEFREKFTKSFADSGKTSSKLARAVGIRTEAVLFAFDRKWDEANNHFEHCLEMLKGAAMPIIHEAMARTDYAWVLRKQGKYDDARTQIEKAEKLYEKIGSKFNIDRLKIMLNETEKPS